ncbi:hypothetical protein STSP2_01013 [Anaerohalosphaera lusitana]|uniref:DUF2752 domain-containing protein n=1 Tax=Anaerohalosphaera lusitana TaxID=1936003 RepID=A0A1U9NIW4_9BACT|nr:hypothetical protein STSP2_01013 [Anaerohalosphaera lusitana]
MCAGLVAAGVLFEVDDVGTHFAGWKWGVHCMLDGAGGGECFWCGMSRGFAAMVKGRFSEGVEHGVAGVTLFGLVLWQGGYSVAGLWRWPRRMRKKLRTVNVVLSVAAGAVIIWGWWAG